MTHINLVHLKLREHSCPYCPGVAYQTKSHLKTHIETVHDTREAARPRVPLLPRRCLRGEGQPEEAHQDGAREAQGPRLRLLQWRGVRDGRQPEEAHQRDPSEDQAQ